MVSTAITSINTPVFTKGHFSKHLFLLRHLQPKSITHCYNHKNEHCDIPFPNTSLESPERWLLHLNNLVSFFQSFFLVVAVILLGLIKKI